jgi:hypothetical protein
MHDFSVRKIVLLSSSVLNIKDNFIVVMILNKMGELAYCKSNDQS